MPPEVMSMSFDDTKCRTHLSALAENIRRARIKAGLSQVELAEKCALSQGNLSRIETGERRPSVLLLFRIAEVLERWRPERLGATDRALLRLGCAELLYIHDIPIKVTLDEYIELAREFGDDSSAAFVNGILDAIHKKNPPNTSSPPSDQPAT